MDVDEVELKFKTNSDTSLPLEKYFERQQLCQDLLKDTKELIREVSMKCTSLGHLQKVLHMVRTVRKYERDADMYGTGSYKNLHNYFIARGIEHIEDRVTLGQVQTANTEVTSDKLEDLKYEMGNLVTKNSESKTLS